jgi:hypothetical protein
MDVTAHKHIAVAVHRSFAKVAKKIGGICKRINARLEK